MPNDFPIISENMFEFRNEKVFSVSLHCNDAQVEHKDLPGFLLILTSLNLHKIGIQLSKVSLTLTCPGMTESDPTEMLPKPMQPKDQLQKVFVLPTGPLPLPVTITYYIQVNECVPNYRYELVDLLCMTQLWFAARRRQFTDFEFLVSGKVFPAHRAVLAARSPVLANLLSQSEVEFLRIDDIDSHVFENFLHFIYTGRLTISASHAQLQLAAERYQIETLKRLCQDATQESEVHEATLIS